MKKIVLTGSPSSGKTTLLQNLARSGFSVVSESAMQVIGMYKEELGGLEAWKEHIRPNWVIHKRNFQAFIERTIDFQQKQESWIQDNWQYVFLDRWTLDYLSFASLRGIEIPKSIEDLMRHTSQKYTQVIHLPVIPEKFLQRADTGRVITLDEAIRFDSINKEIWSSLEIEKSTILIPWDEASYLHQTLSLLWWKLVAPGAELICS